MGLPIEAQVPVKYSVDCFVNLLNERTQHKFRYVIMYSSKQSSNIVSWK